MSNCKVITFFSLCQCLRWPLSNPYILSVSAVTIVMSHYSTSTQTIPCAYATRDGGGGLARETKPILLLNKYYRAFGMVLTSGEQLVESIKIISDMKPKSSCGIDGLSMKLLKMNKEVFI